MEWCVGTVIVSSDHVKTAMSNQLTRKVVYDRIDMYGWSIEKAVSTPLPKRLPKKYTQQDVNEALANGIAYKTFISRIRIYKWDVGKAKTYPVKYQGKRSSLACKNISTI